jgi:RNA polymerase II-associated factor 1
MGKAGAETSSITFLRRPEPVSIDRPKPDAGAGMNGGGPLLSKALRGPSKPQPHPEPRPDRHKETPEHVLKTIIKGFDIAYPKSAYKGPDTAEKIQGHEPTAEEIRAWQRPQHPKRPDLRLVNSFPILPDLEAYPDTGGYITVKFATNPVPPSRTYDERLDFGILRPLEQRPELKAAQLAAAAAHAADPSKPPPGPPMFDYVYFLPEDPKTVPSLRRKLDPLEAHGDEGGDGEAGGTAFRYARIRSYETASATGGIGKKFDDIVLAMYDPVAFDTEDADVASASRKRKQKGAYYYPILQKCQIRPRRDIIVNPSMPGAPRPAPLAEEEDADQADVLSLVIRAPDEAERARRGQLRSEYDPNAPVVQPAEDAAADADPNGAANGTTNGHAAEQGE